MKYFVLTVLRLYDKLDELSDALTATAERAATSVKWDAEELMLYLMDINDKKRMLANVKVMRDRIINDLGPAAEILRLYALGASAEEIAETENVSRSTALRRLSRALSDGVRVLSRLGITAEKLENEYFTLPIIKTVYEKIRLARSPKNARERVITPRSRAAFSSFYPRARA